MVLACCRVPLRGHAVAVAAAAAAVAAVVVVMVGLLAVCYLRHQKASSTLSVLLLHQY